MQIPNPDQNDIVLREMQAEIASWSPRRGPDFNSLRDRADKRSFQVFRLYAVAGAAMAAVIVAAYLAIAGLHLGSFATTSVEEHTTVSHTR